MNDDLSRKNRLWASGLTCLFCAGLIVWTTVYGSPANSLHGSAQAWSFALLAGILAGMGFGAIAQFFPIGGKSS